MSDDRSSPRREFDFGFSFVSHGVRIGLEANEVALLDKARHLVNQAFGGLAKVFEGAASEVDHNFGLAYEEGRFRLFRNGIETSSGTSERNFFKFLNSALRLQVAELAKGQVFIHAGVVGVGGRGIVIPGTSFAGKSTLTAELIRNGAEYYSDEYAVLDKKGWVHPFPRHLSMRYFGATRERDVAPEEFGGSVGTEAIPVGMLLFTSFAKGAEWQPEFLTPGQGIMEMIPHTLTMHRDPAFALKVLDLVARRAIMVKSPRGDVKKFAKFLLAFFDKHSKLAKMT